MVTATLALTLFASTSYTIVGTNQDDTFGNTDRISAPKPGEPFFGQDAQVPSLKPSYSKLADGTIRDNVTGLIWMQAPAGRKTWREAVDEAKSCQVGGHHDWRLPSIKELYSLIQFTGVDDGPDRAGTPFIDTKTFAFTYGDPTQGQRPIDAQYWSSTAYVSTTMNHDPTAFGVNFADGRIKGYPAQEVGPPGRRFQMRSYALYVRGNPKYGKNQFVAGPADTVVDLATGLMWTRRDSGRAMDWRAALDYAENLSLANHTDWHLPSVKQLESIVDYRRSPDTSDSPAIDPIFTCTAIKNEAGQKDWPQYWSSTTHLSRPLGATQAAYIAFGRSLGWMQFPQDEAPRCIDVHGAGSQRSDPKSGSASDFPFGRGPQGDVIRIQNFVRCVRVCSEQELSTYARAKAKPSTNLR